MKEFYNNVGFILAFLILTLIINMTLGSKIAIGFLTLTLLSMIVLNANRITQLLNNAFTVKKNEGV